MKFFVVVLTKTWLFFHFGRKMWFCGFDSKISLYNFGRKCEFTVLTWKHDFQFSKKKCDFVILEEKIGFCSFDRKIVFYDFSEKTWFCGLMGKHNFAIHKCNVFTIHMYTFYVHLFNSSKKLSFFITSLNLGNLSCVHICTSYIRGS